MILDPFDAGRYETMSEERRRQEAHEAEEQKRKEESPRAKTEEHERE